MAVQTRWSDVISSSIASQMVVIVRVGDSGD